MYIPAFSTCSAVSPGFLITAVRLRVKYRIKISTCENNPHVHNSRFENFISCRLQKNISYQFEAPVGKAPRIVDGTIVRSRSRQLQLKKWDAVL